jgi:hypothetical protein
VILEDYSLSTLHVLQAEDEAPISGEHFVLGGRCHSISSLAILRTQRERTFESMGEP